MPTPETKTTLWRHGRIDADDWIILADDEPIPPTGKVAVSKARYLAERTALLARTDVPGILLGSGEPLGEIENDIDRIGLVALHFPRYADGRSYSTARILRDRLGYKGELRARGDVLRDQIAFMIRVGFDSLEISHPGTLAALREGRAIAVHRHYQPASVAGEAAGTAYSWRRASTAI